MKWEDTGSGTFELPPVGTHVARLIRIVDIGTQTGEYQGQPTVRRQNILTWELPDELREDGQPFIISKFYTASLGEKANLTKDLTNWLGSPPPKPFDPQSLLGKGCQVIVSQRENSDKRVVSGLASLPKSVKLEGETHNPLVFFSLDEFDQEVFDNLSEGVQKMIVKSPEYVKAISGGEEVESKPDDSEIPF